MMMIRALAGIATALALLAAGGPALAGDRPEYEALRLPDNFMLAVTLKRSGVQERPSGKTSWTLNQSYGAQVTANDRGYRVRVDDLSGQSTGDLPIDAMATRLAGGIDYQTEQTLSPIAILNWPAVADGIRRAVDNDVIPVSPELRSTLKQTLTSLSPDDAAITFLLPQTYLSFVQGVVLSEGETIDFDGEVANPLGGAALPTLNTIRLESRDRTARREVVIWSQTLERTATRRILADTIRAMMQRAGRTLPPGMIERFVMDRTDTCRFEIDMVTGLVIKADCEIKVAVDAGDGVSFVRTSQRMVMTQEIVLP